MADKLLKSIKFPTLPDRYVIGDASLSEEGAAADAKATGDEITNVKSDINYEWGEVFESVPYTTITGIPGARMKADGTIPSSGLYDVTAMVPITEGVPFSVDFSLKPNAIYETIVIGYFSENEFSSSNLIAYEEECVSGKKYFTPNNTKYIALTCPTGTHPIVTTYDSNIDSLKSITAELTSESSTTAITKYANARLTNNAEVVSSSIYDISNMIPVGTYKKLSLDYSATPPSPYVVIGYFRTDEYSSSSIIASEASVATGVKYTIPDETSFIALTMPTGTTPTVTFYRSKVGAIESKIADLYEEKSRGTVARKSTMTTGDSVSAIVGNLKKNTVLGFTANITTFGSLQIGQGRTANAETAYLIINETDITVYSYYGSEAHVEGTYTHGLTISDYLDICIEESNNELGYAKIRITSNGQTYAINRVRWAGCNKNVYADAISGNYSNCLLSYYCADYLKDMWLFGDSYFDHWCAYCLASGYNNFLCDGFSGRGSADAFSALEVNLEHGKPNSIVWCLGMNNGDSSSAVNSTWKLYYDKIVSLCAEKGINLVLCTIPNVPSVNNNYKNAIIRSSGYRYIDLAKAVGSDISTSWYNGLLSSDEVHPSSLGDEMIARFMESAIPEITK